MEAWIEAVEDLSGEEADAVVSEARARDGRGVAEGPGRCPLSPTLCVYIPATVLIVRMNVDASSIKVMLELIAPTQFILL